MNATIEWFGFSVARKHVYFYSLLIVASIFANTIKDQIIDQGETEVASSELQELAEQAAAFKANSTY